MPEAIIFPTTFNDDNNVAALFNVVAPDIFNDDNNVDAPETYKLVKLVLLKIEVDVACKFGIFNAEYVDKLFKFVLVAYTDKSGLFVTAL